MESNPDGSGPPTWARSYRNQRPGKRSGCECERGDGGLLRARTGAERVVALVDDSSALEVRMRF